MSQKKIVELKDAQGNTLYPLAGYGPIPEGSILCISKTNDTFAESYLSATGRVLDSGTWYQFGIFGRPKKFAMEIIVPAGEKWTIKFKTMAPMVEGGTGSYTNTFILVGSVRLTGDNTTGAEWYDSSIFRHQENYWHNGVVTETVQTFTAGTYYFGVWAARYNNAHINGGGTTTTRPGRSGSWKRSTSVIQIATLVKRDKA